jgi:Fe2+ transport system protein FeoA
MALMDPNPVSMPAGESDQPLHRMRAGESGTVRCCLMSPADRELLAAMGLADQCKLRVCRAGSTCIVQVACTRLGLSAEIAQRIFVRVEGKPLASTLAAPATA